MINIQKLQYHLDCIVNYIHSNMKLVNCHMVNYITDEFWETFIPPQIKAEIKSDFEIEQALDNFFGDLNVLKFPKLNEFLAANDKFKLENNRDLLINKADLLNEIGLDTKSSVINIKEFMNEKKNHEVQIVGSFISNLLQKKNYANTFVVDAGDGKGYLSSRLALEYKLKVLGVDANESNTKGAIKRSKKLERAWKSLTERAETINQGNVPPKRGKKSRNPTNSSILSESSDNYKTTSQYITPSTDFPKLLNEFFDIGDKSIEVCLSGLHTCGNLSPTCLQIFVEQENIQTLCNIGCCYHLLVEEFIKDEFFANKEKMENITSPGFPLSNYLRRKEFKLGRNARMLASQSIHRTKANRELPNQSLLYRAVLEALIVENRPELKNCVQVGKIKKYSSFVEYVKICNTKFDLGLNHLDDESIEIFFKKYEMCGKFLNLFYLLRMQFASVLETVILLDRLLYLKESSINKSYIVRFFDPVISPRCYGIVSIK